MIKLEDTKRVIRSHKSKKDTQHNDFLDREVLLNRKLLNHGFVVITSSVLMSPS